MIGQLVLQYSCVCWVRLGVEVHGGALVNILTHTHSHPHTPSHTLTPSHPTYDHGCRSVCRPKDITSPVGCDRGEVLFVGLKHYFSSPLPSHPDRLTNFSSSLLSLFPISSHSLSSLQQTIFSASLLSLSFLSPLFLPTNQFFFLSLLSFLLLLSFPSHKLSFFFSFSLLSPFSSLPIN